MKWKVFYRVCLCCLGISLFAGVLPLVILYSAGSAVNSAAYLPWDISLSFILSIAAGYLVSRGVEKELREIDPQEPEKAETVPELTPLLERLREQSRIIRQQEKMLGRERQDFAAITANMSEGFILLDKRMNILSSNAAAQQLFAGGTQSRGENIQTNGCPREICLAAGYALTGKRQELTIASDKRSYYVLAGPVISSEQIIGAAVVILDVTEREQREAFRREFTANVSHELKTPLTSITGFAELIRDGMVPPERISEFAGDIHREATRLLSLVNDILELSRLEVEQRQTDTERVDLLLLAQEQVQLLSAAAQKAQVTLTAEGESAFVTGSARILGELIYNLCDNAIKYNNPGGMARVTVCQNASEASLTVEDNGIGIPHSDQNRVFERFYRVDKSHSRQLGGTGLGLSIVKHAAQMHNARLELWSEPDSGTKISVVFKK